MQPLIKQFDLANEFYFKEGCFIAEVSNSDDDPELSIARVRVEVGVTTKLHSLRKCIERYVILEGRGLVKLAGLTPHNVFAGDVVIIPQSCPQCVTNVGSRDLIFLAICTPRFNKNQYQEILEQGE